MNDLVDMELFAVFVVATVGFSAIYFLSFAFWHLVPKHIPENDLTERTPMLASYIPAAVHGSLVVYLSVRNLMNLEDWKDFSNPNSQEQANILAISAGYFAADTVSCLVPFDADFVYMVHHVVTIIFFGAALHGGLGATPCILGLLLGEITNPGFHIYNILNDIRPWTTWAQKAFCIICPVFTVSFIAVRTVVGIPMAWWWSSKVAAIEDVSWLHRGIWIISAVGITIVSQTFTHRFAKETWELLRTFHVVNRVRSHGEVSESSKSQ